MGLCLVLVQFVYLAEPWRWWRPSLPRWRPNPAACLLLVAVVAAAGLWSHRPTAQPLRPRAWNLQPAPEHPPSVTAVLTVSRGDAKGFPRVPALLASLATLAEPGTLYALVVVVPDADAPLFANALEGRSDGDSELWAPLLREPKYGLGW